MFVTVICILSSLSFHCVDSTNFDQRQIGDVNVQVDVKDVQIFAMMKGNKEEEYMDYDYTYDYSEFTIKPQNRTTQRPSSTEPISLKYNSTTASSILQEQTIEPLTIDSTTLDSIATTNNFDSVDIKITQNNMAEIDDTKKTVTTTPRSTKIKCKKGFVLNKKGDCQLQLNNTGNALLKLVQLSQRLKLRRDNKRNDNS